MLDIEWKVDSDNAPGWSGKSWSSDVFGFQFVLHLMWMNKECLHWSLECNRFYHDDMPTGAGMFHYEFEQESLPLDKQEDPASDYETVIAKRFTEINKIVECWLIYKIGELCLKASKLDHLNKLLYGTVR